MVDAHVVDIEAVTPAVPASDSLSNATTAAVPSDEPTLNETLNPVRLIGNGHHELAEFMARYPGAAILRRFRTLHMLKLLYLQSRLVGLELDLKKTAEADRESDDPKRQEYCRNFRLLENHILDPASLDRNDHQRMTWHKIRELLAEYDESLRNMNTLLNMPKAEKRDLKFLQSWMDNEGDIVLTGKDWNLWSISQPDELMAMVGRTYEDFITRWVEERFLPHFHRWIGRRFLTRVPGGDPLSGMLIYKIGKMGFYISVFVVSITSALPLIAIGVLSYPFATHTKLALIAMFTIIFSFFLGFVSGTRKKVEVIAASAAFIAIQVVFISGQKLITMLNFADQRPYDAALEETRLNVSP